MMIQSTQLCTFALRTFPFSLLPFPFCEAATSTTVENPLQSRPFFLQNKPNFPEGKMSATSLLTKCYENKSNPTLGENKPKQTQSPKSSNEPKLFYYKGLSKSAPQQPSAKQTQYKPNFAKARNERKLKCYKGLSKSTPPGDKSNFEPAGRPPVACPKSRRSEFPMLTYPPNLHNIWLLFS
jgi:hypothetical protein